MAYGCTTCQHRLFVLNELWRIWPPTHAHIVEPFLWISGLQFVCQRMEYRKQTTSSRLFIISECLQKSHEVSWLFFSLGESIEFQHVFSCLPLSTVLPIQPPCLTKGHWGTHKPVRTLRCLPRSNRVKRSETEWNGLFQKKKGWNFCRSSICTDLHSHRPRSSSLHLGVHLRCLESIAWYLGFSPKKSSRTSTSFSENLWKVLRRVSLMQVCGPHSWTPEACIHGIRSLEKKNFLHSSKSIFHISNHLLFGLS